MTAWWICFAAVRRTRHDCRHGGIGSIDEQADNAPIVDLNLRIRPGRPHGDRHSEALQQWKSPTWTCEPLRLELANRSVYGLEPAGGLAVEIKAPVPLFRGGVPARYVGDQARLRRAGGKLFVLFEEAILRIGAEDVKMAVLDAESMHVASLPRIPCVPAGAEDLGDSCLLSRHRPKLRRTVARTVYDGKVCA